MESRIMKTVIMAGGKGTRISSVFSGIPKPMIEVGGKPVLEREIECLRDQGFTDIIITVSYKADVIMDYFGDGGKISPATGRPFGVHIEYYRERESLGNAGALFKIRDNLDGDFLLLNADSLFDIDFNRFIRFHEDHNALLTLFTHPSTHPYDSSLIVSGDEERVERWLTKEDERPLFYHNRVNAGLHVVNSSLLYTCGIDPSEVGKRCEDGKIFRVDLDRDIIRPLASSGKLFAYDSPEYVKDMGTPERYLSVSEDWKRGIIGSRNLKNRQRAVFLDRDGTINRLVGFLKNMDDFVLIEGVAEAVRKINASGYLCIVVTNQPVIARGDITLGELDEIHMKMETLLGEKGAYLDAVYFCPHHPDKGYEGERSQFKIECSCRKPKPGMLLEAAERFNIDLQSSWMVGDSRSDVEAGKNAGCRTALIGPGSFGQDLTVSSLSDFTDRIFL